MSRYRSNNYRGDVFGFFCFLIAIIVILVIVLAPRTDPEHATRTLEAAGFTNIHITGYRWGMGGEHDHYVTGFEATGPKGQRVSGAVTAGYWLKGSTIRFD